MLTKRYLRLNAYRILLAETKSYCVSSHCRVQQTTMKVNELKSLVVACVLESFWRSKYKNATLDFQQEVSPF